MSYNRFALFFVPPNGALAEFGSNWLGWDVDRGHEAHQFDVAGLNDVTDTPRKYGFHATLKPPFRLVDGSDVDGLSNAVEALATRLTPAQSDGLALTRLGRFLALTLVGDTKDIDRLAATCVSELDMFRAPLDGQEMARRQNARLTDRQQEMLLQWGYPYVMDDFRFHMTLTRRLPKNDIDDWYDTAQLQLPPLPNPFVLNQIALVGERPDGNFEVLQRFALVGAG